MRDPKRIDEVLGLIKDIWVANPDWRLSQLLLNCGLTTAKPDSGGLVRFLLDPSLEDDEVVSKLYISRAKYAHSYDKSKHV